MGCFLKDHLLYTGITCMKCQQINWGQKSAKNFCKTLWFYVLIQNISGVRMSSLWQCILVFNVTKFSTTLINFYSFWSNLIQSDPKVDHVILMVNFLTFWNYFFFQVLECRVCDNVFGVQGDKIPRLLFCGHTFCHSCLSRLPQSIPNLIETESGSEVSANIFIQCPFDRQPTTLGTLWIQVNIFQKVPFAYHFVKDLFKVSQFWNLFGLQFFQKTNEKKNLFVEELKTQKRHFEMNWPLFRIINLYIWYVSCSKKPQKSKVPEFFDQLE